MTWQTILDQLTELVTAIGLRVVAAIVLLVVGLKLVRRLKKRMHTAHGLQELPTRACGRSRSARPA